MSIFKLYSKQKKTEESPQADLYRYDQFPEELRVQLCQILDDLFARGYPFFQMEQLYRLVHQTLCREYGLQRLPFHPNRAGDREAVGDFLLNVRDVNKCLDVLQVAFAILFERDYYRGMPSFMENVPYAAEYVNQAVSECNHRFKEHQVGFQFVGGQILKIDGEFTHQQLTVPALKLLEQDYLAGANQEFFAAFDHYRYGQYKECLNECLKAFESTMKAICHKRGWPYGQNDTAKTLIGICEKNNLFPVFMESHLAGLRSSLESGVPTARNRLGGHGQGVTQITVSPEFATYVLNLAATNIRFLASSEQAMP